MVKRWTGGAVVMWGQTDLIVVMQNNSVVECRWIDGGRPVALTVAVAYGTLEYN